MAEPYTDDWLRERGAFFNPLTGRRVPPLPKESVPAKTQKHVDFVQETITPQRHEESTSVGATVGIPQFASESVPIAEAGHRPAPAGPPDGHASTSTVEDYPPVRRKTSRLPLIIGILLAIAAVVAAEHYLVPIFTHHRTKEVANTLPPQSSQVAHVVTPTSSKVTKPSITAAASTPQSSVPHVNQSTTPVPSTNAQASVTPVPRTEAPMPRAEPTVPRSTPSATPQIQRPVPPSQPAAIPSPQERESKAQYEQQHMQQLLSPLG